MRVVGPTCFSEWGKIALVRIVAFVQALVSSFESLAQDAHSIPQATHPLHGVSFIHLGTSILSSID